MKVRESVVTSRMAATFGRGHEREPFISSPGEIETVSCGERGVLLGRQRGSRRKCCVCICEVGLAWTEHVGPDTLGPRVLSGLSPNVHARYKRNHADWVKERRWNGIHRPGRVGCSVTKTK